MGAPGCFSIYLSIYLDGFIWWLGSKESAYQCRTSLIPQLGRYPGDGNGNSFPYSCLGNLMDRGAWWASPWGHTESDTAVTEQQQSL